MKTARLSVGLVACASVKAATPQPARRLYQSELFRRASAYAARTYDHWFVLSARHYLVHPDEVLEPYDQCLARMPLRDRQHWGSLVELGLRCGHGCLTEGRQWPVTTPRLPIGEWVTAAPPGTARRADLWFHAGADYIGPVRDRIAQCPGTPFDIHAPLAGLGIGQQLAWYGQRAGQEPPR